MKKILPYIGLGLISLIPLLWFKGDLIIAHGDDALFLNPGACFNSIKWSWDTFFYNCGGANNSMPLLFPLSLFWFLFTKLGIGLAVIERIWLVVVWFLTGFSILYLGRILNLRPIASFFAMVLYLVNIFVAQQPLIYNFRLPYMTLPLFLAFTIKGLYPGNNMIKYIILFSLSTILLVSAWTNPPWILPSFILISFYLLYRLISAENKGERLRVIFFILGIALFTSLLNLWWFIPNLFTFSKSIGSIRGLNLNIFIGRGFYEVFRFLKSWAFGYSGYEYHKAYYNSWIIILASYLIPIIVFSSLFRRGKGFRDYWFFIFMSLLFMFLAKGPLPPLGGIYNYMFRNLPGFVMFREPYTKFMPIVILAFAILFGDSVNWLINIMGNKFKHYSSIYFSVSVFFIVCIAGVPIFTKNIFWQRQNGWKENKGERSAYVRIPEYWYLARDWFKSHFKDGNLFALPRSTGVYNWSSGFNSSGTVAKYLLDTPIISCSGNSNTALRLVNAIYDTFVEDRGNLCYLLRLFNISYIVHDKDIYTNTNWRFHDVNYLPPHVMEKRLKKQGGLDIQETIGHLDFYKIKDEYYLPKIYVANNLSYIDGTLSDLVLAPLEEYYLGRPALLLKEGSPIKTLPVDLVKRINNHISVSRGIGCGDRSIMKVLESGDYNIFLKLVPNFINQIETSKSRIDVDLTALIPKGKYNPNSISSYDYKIYPYGIVLALPFDGVPQEDEYLQIKDFEPDGEDIDTDLTQYPYLGLCYRVEDPDVQTLQLTLGIDIDGDGKENFWLRDIFERPAPTKFSYFYYDACGKAQRMLQLLVQKGELKIDRDIEYYHAVKLEIYPHKLWGVDCSQDSRNYNFYLKDLGFFGKYAPLKSLIIKDRVLDDFSQEKEMVIKSDTKEVVLYIEPVDLTEYNQIEFQWQGMEKNSLINVKLDIDIDNDSLPDREEVVYTFNGSTEVVSHLVDFRNIMTMGYEDIPGVRLLSVHWSSDNLEPSEIRKNLERLIIYRWNPVKDYKNFSFKDYIFSLNNRRYTAEFSSLGNTRSKGIIVQYENINLISGRNIIENLLAENDPFYLEWVCFKKSKPRQIPEEDLPRIKWQKINPTEYMVNVTGATGSFLLVFSESFHNEWKAYILPNKTEVKEHIPVNGYAQGWWVGEGSPDFQILIRYRPQVWASAGYIISGITLLGCLIYLCCRK